MKNLFYKEMKLSMHPVCWVFVFAFPLLILIPNYPIFISFIYIGSCYPILFLGANKGQQSNDIYFSTLLPISKKEIIKARMLTTLFLLSVSSLIIIALSPLSGLINAALESASGKPQEFVGFTVKGIISCVAFAFVGFTIFDFIFYPLFYRNGRGVLAGTLIGLFFLCTFLVVFELVLPLSHKDYFDFFCSTPIYFQLIYLLVAILIYFFAHLLLLKICTKLLNKVDL